MPNLRFPRGTIVKLQRTCAPCRDALHTECHAWLAEVFGDDLAPSLACPCPCRDDYGQLTLDALTEMARRHPERLARHVRFQETFRRGTFALHNPHC